MRRKAFFADCGCWGPPGSCTHGAAFQRSLCQDVQAYGRVFGEINKTPKFRLIISITKVLILFADLQGDAVVCVPHPLPQPQGSALVLQQAKSREDT